MKECEPCWEELQFGLWPRDKWKPYVRGGGDMKEFDLSDTKKYPIPLWEREWRAYEDNCLKEHKSELQVRTDALSAECRCYLAICNGLENPHLSDVGRNYLKTEQEKMMDVITKNIHLKAELGEFLRFRNATLKPQNGK